MFTYDRFSDAVRHAVHMQEMKLDRYEYTYGKPRETAPIGWYSFVDEWENYMPTELDRIIDRTFPESF